MDSIDQLLIRRVEKILPSKEGLNQLISKKKIKLYLGIDPTAPKLHLGHTIGIRKLQQFADAGHNAILLFGTGTILAGDPSQRETARKRIAAEQIDHNISTWKDQVKNIIDFNKVNIMYNGEWLLQLTLKDIIEIASHISAVQLFKRDMFQRRLARGDTVWMHETLYPLLQGYDSVAMDVDLELGGSDQEFNMLIGRELQQKMNHREKFVLTIPLIAGTDGEFMSKSRGNCVWLTDTPEDMFGKIMSLPDTQIRSYWELVTNLPLEELTGSPLKDKKRLAFTVVSDFHGQAAAQVAQTHFETTVQQGQAPTNIPTFVLSQLPQNSTIIDLLETAKLVQSRGGAKRLIEQKGVSINQFPIYNLQFTIKDLKSGDIISIGKRKWLKLV